MPQSNAGQGRAAGQGVASRVFGWVVWAGLLLMLGANLPGHLSWDSVTQLHEARVGVRETWAPAIMSWILARFDDVVPGTGLYVAVSAALLAVSLVALRGLRSRTSWLAVVLAAALVLSPDFLIYQAIVWKDVLFANLAIAGFVCLAYAAERWERRPLRLGALAAALLLLAVGALVRQNGMVAVLFAAMVVGWSARGRGWRSGTGWGLAWLVAAVVLIQLIGGAVQLKGSSAAQDTRRGVRVLQHYDIIGSLAHDPKIRLDILKAASPHAEQMVRNVGVKVYSPERVDTFHSAPTLGPSLWPVPDQAMAAQWRSVILEHPDDYLLHRARVFWWVLATPDLDRCLPFFVGVQGPPQKLANLKIPAVVEPQDAALYVYAKPLTKTPVFSHLTYAAVGLAVALVLLWRRDPADMAMLGLLAAAFAFTASFFVISVACDYRYLYFLDMAAMTGLLYLALDPTLRRRGRS